MFEHGAVTLFRIRGVPIRAHWTLLLILPYLAFALSLQFRGVAQLAGVSHERLLLPPLVWGAVLAAGLFASITAHEPAHTFVAIRFGGRVHSITLMLVGGVSQLVRVPQRASHEAIMAAVGPLTSLVLGALLLLGYLHADTWPADVQMGLFYLAATNLTLGLFNLVPAFPMDGGRLLRSALALRLDRARATQIAASVGKFCAIALGFVGLWSANVLLMLVAVFVYTGASSEVLHERVRGALEGLRIVDLVPLLRGPLPLVASDAPVSHVLPRMRRYDRLELVVVDAGGNPLGVLQPADLSVADPSRSATTAGELVALVPKRHVVVPSSTSANDAIQQAADVDAPYLVVVDPDTPPPDNLVGLVSADDIARTVQLELTTRSRRPTYGPHAPIVR